MLAQSLCHSLPTSVFWRPWSPLSNAKSWGGGVRPGQEGEGSKCRDGRRLQDTQKKCKLRGSIPVFDGEVALGGRRA